MAEWYAFLSKLNNLLSPIITGTAKEINIPVLTALLLGVLGSTAPCQLSTNASALGLLAQKIDDRRKALIGTFAFIAGKVITYTLIGSITILLGIRLNQLALPVIQLIRQALGPLMLLIGLFLIGIYRPLFIKFNFGESLLNISPKTKILPEFILGIVFSLAFCPTLFWLFFGMVVPLGLTTQGGIVLPAIFALGTAIPLLIFVGLLTFGFRQAGSTIRDIRKFNILVQKISGVVFILAGINDIISYWFI